MRVNGVWKADQNRVVFDTNITESRICTKSSNDEAGVRVEPAPPASLQNPRDVLGESDGFRRLRDAGEKAHGDHDRAIRNVCSLYGVKTLDALQALSGR